MKISLSLGLTDWAKAATEIHSERQHRVEYFMNKVLLANDFKIVKKPFHCLNPINFFKNNDLGKEFHSIKEIPNNCHVKEYT